MKYVDFEVIQIVVMFFLLASGVAFAQAADDHWHLWAGSALALIPQGRLLIRTYEYRSAAKPAWQHFFVNECVVVFATALYFSFA